MAETRWQDTAPAHRRQTRLIVHVSLARILYLPPSSETIGTSLGLASDDPTSRELSIEQIHGVDAACSRALDELGLRGLEFYADALWYVELESADLTQTRYAKKFSLHTTR